jgi:hypothetical protein
MSTSPARVSSVITVGIKRQVVDRTAQVIYATFPKMSVAQEGSRKYFAVFLTIAGSLGFLALLAINTLLAQDAFTLSNLKIEAKMVADQRDAINREIDAKSAPNALANAATKLGMSPSESPIFLNLQPSEVSNG